MAYRPKAYHLIIPVNELIRCHHDTLARQTEQNCQVNMLRDRWVMNWTNRTDVLCMIGQKVGYFCFSHQVL